MSLRENARFYRKQNGFLAALCFFIAAILSGGLLMVCVFFIDLALLILPFFVLPIFFSFERAIIYLRNNSTLTFSLIFSGYTGYYSERFRSTYNVLGEIWKLIIIYFATSFVSVIVGFIAFYYTNFLGFQDMIVKMMSLKNVTLDSFNSIIDSYPDAYRAFTIVNFVPAATLTSIIGLFLYSTNSVSFFIRISEVKFTGRFIKRIFVRFKKDNASRFYGRFMSLNWPLFVLFILGFALGGYLGYIYKPQSAYIFTFGLVTAFILSFGVFGSFYIANKEAIYFSFINEIQQASFKVKKELEDYLRTIRWANSDEDIKKAVDEVLIGEDEKENDSNES